MAPADAVAGSATLPVGAAPARLQVDVVYSPGPGQVDLVAVEVDAGATVADALGASGLLERHGLQAELTRIGVWCKLTTLSAPLRDHDRIEIYRPLTVDPKEARRQRYKRTRPVTAAA